MSKTPYEIRLELLKLANEILTNPVYNDRDAEMNKYRASRELYPGEAEPRNPLPFPTLAEFPTAEEIVKKAEELKKFVDGN
jgi:hypothetical protein